jgi:hypothetical protein
VIDFIKFLCILIFEVGGVVDYFDGLPDDAGLIKVLHPRKQPHQLYVIRGTIKIVEHSYNFNCHNVYKLGKVWLHFFSSKSS